MPVQGGDRGQPVGRLVNALPTLQTLTPYGAKIKAGFNSVIAKTPPLPLDNTTELTEINANGGSGAGHLRTPPIV